MEKAIDFCVSDFSGLFFWRETQLRYEFIKSLFWGCVRLNNPDKYFSGNQGCDLWELKDEVITKLKLENHKKSKIKKRYSTYLWDIFVTVTLACLEAMVWPKNKIFQNKFFKIRKIGSCNSNTTYKF